MARRPDPDWGQAVRAIADAVTGKHTRAAKGMKAGCLDAVILFVGVVVLIGQVVVGWL